MRRNMTELSGGSSPKTFLEPDPRQIRQDYVAKRKLTAESCRFDEVFRRRYLRGLRANLCGHCASAVNLLVRCAPS